MNDEDMRKFLTWRGVREPCSKCKGSGSFYYNSTSLWRGGVGGAAMTYGVCDVCWGSGDAHKKWTDISAMDVTIREGIKRGMLNALQKDLGIAFKFLKREGPILRLADELDKLASKKFWKEWFLSREENTAKVLAKYLRDMVDSAHEEN